MNNIKSNIRKDEYCIWWCWLDYKLIQHGTNEINTIYKSGALLSLFLLFSRCTHLSTLVHRDSLCE